MEENTINTRGAQRGTKIKGMLIEVTSALIETAMPQNSSHCMIADAVKAAAINKKMRIGKVVVDLQAIRFTDRDTGRRYTCWNPIAGQQAIVQFDRGIKPEPFSFRLKPVQITEKAQRSQGRNKAVITVPNKNGTGSPVKLGGKPLPVSPGLRRIFGVRTLGMPQTKIEEAEA